MNLFILRFMPLYLFHCDGSLEGWEKPVLTIDQNKLSAGNNYQLSHVRIQTLLSSVRGECVAKIKHFKRLAKYTSYLKIG